MNHDTESVPLSTNLPEDTARAVFLSWERLRLVYNVALATIVLGASRTHFTNVNFLEFLVFAAVAANLCFCAGPVVEGYGVLLGANRQAVRWVVFVAGLLLACLLTIGALISWQMPHFN